MKLEWQVRVVYVATDLFRSFGPDLLPWGSPARLLQVKTITRTCGKDVHRGVLEEDISPVDLLNLGSPADSEHAFLREAKAAPPLAAPHSAAIHVPSAPTYLNGRRTHFDFLILTSMLPL